MEGRSIHRQAMRLRPRLHRGVRRRPGRTPTYGSFGRHGHAAAARLDQQALSGVRSLRPREAPGVKPSFLGRRTGGDASHIQTTVSSGCRGGAGSCADDAAPGVGPVRCDEARWLAERGRWISVAIQRRRQPLWARVASPGLGEVRVGCGGGVDGRGFGERSKIVWSTRCCRVGVTRRARLVPVGRAFRRRLTRCRR